MEDDARYIVTIRNLATGDVHDYESLTLERAMDVVDSYVEAGAGLRVTLERAALVGEWTDGRRTR